VSDPFGECQNFEQSLGAALVCLIGPDATILIQGTVA
jgi:hypothetical protein